VLLSIDVQPVAEYVLTVLLPLAITISSRSLTVTPDGMVTVWLVPAVVVDPDAVV
jgi:hypothetical protein